MKKTTILYTLFILIVVAVIMTTIYVEYHHTIFPNTNEITN